MTRLLHVACMPFPTCQGTQAAVGAMLDASSSRDSEVRLLTYWARGYEELTRYAVDRLPNHPKVPSLRSGPSVGKLALDARCVFEVRRLARLHRFDAIVAHHVEAGAAAILADVAPVFYVAHTSLASELPIYLPKLPASIISFAGSALEHWVRARATGTAAVAPALTKVLGRGAVYLPVPWAAHRASIAGVPQGAQHAARTELGLGVGGPVALYAGNLDRYQGWDVLLGALKGLVARRADARLLLATESDPRPALDLARHCRVDQALTVVSLAGETQRRRVHAAADFAWIPRRTPGGLPIKMLDAFARSLPVIAARRATAGLPVDEACLVVADDDSRAFTDASCHLLEDTATAQQFASRAQSYLASHHSIDAFDGAMGRWLGASVSRRERAARPRSGAVERRAH